MNIYISGMGVVSALGIGISQNESALMAGKTGVSALELIPSAHKGIIPVGEVKHTTEALIAMIKSASKEVTRTAALALLAAEEAIETANLSKEDIAAYKVGIISSSTAGGMRESELYFKDFLAGEKTKDFIDGHDGTDTTEQLAEAFGIKGFHTTINTACSSSANAMILGARMIKSGMLDIAIVGG